MRLLLLTGVYPSPRRPTKGTFNREMIRGLRAAGDEVRVIAPIPWTDLVLASPTTPPDDDVAYPVWWYPPRLALVARHRWMRRTVLPAVRRATVDWHPDLVVGYWTHPDGTVAIEAARRLGVPAVILVGGSDIRILAREPARRAIITETLRRADRVLAVGAGLREQVIALGVDPERVGVFHRGVDTTSFHPGSQSDARQRLGISLDRPLFVWVGRMLHVKGLDVLLDAWRRIQDHAPRPLLLLIGEGELRAQLERRAADMRESVRFVGVVAHDALADWYRAADAVVLPSRSEGIPNVLLEGLACGTPFIASDVGGVGELASEPSMLVPPDDVVALATALLKRLESPDLTRRATGAVLDRAAASSELRCELRAVRHVPHGAGAVA